MNEAQRYLRLHGGYSDHLGGLRWSPTEDALDCEDGSTFAFNEEIALFVEGFAAGRPLIHFAFLLHLLNLLRGGADSAPAQGRNLAATFARTGRPLRNAGAFCAVLCRDLPPTAAPVEPREVLQWLRDPARPIRWYLATFHDNFYPAEAPPLQPEEFEQEFFRHLAPYNEEEVWHWLRHGRGPVKKPAEALAREFPPQPRTLTGALAALLERPRLAGARPFIAQLLSALALPLRHPAPPELPVGGYADVTTHGPPDRLLLSQFALDELDFLRRYADRELLYYRREEPHARTRHELIVLLDQGVRTWGDVRLVLSAAVLALGRRAERAKLPFLVAATSDSGVLHDPVATDEQALGQLIEASDLSANPGLALERVLEAPVVGSRDVVLLTHPRNLLEPDVGAAALRAGPDTRLLALTLDGHGKASLCEVRHGVPVSLREFRVDLSQKEEIRPAPVPAGAPLRPWQGGVELVGFPFRFGTNGPVGASLFDFDLAGERLLTASREGMLHLWKVDDASEVEVLPRAMCLGKVLTGVEAVVGVAGGFVVAGRPGGFFCCHYNLARRTCVVYGWSDPIPPPVDCRYSAAHHCLVAFSRSSNQGVVIDLGLGHTYWPQRGEGPARAKDAWLAAQTARTTASMGYHPLTARGEVVVSSASEPPFCKLDAGDGRLQMYNHPLPWNSFIPQVDGQPALRGCAILEAQCRGPVLAARVLNRNGGGGMSLHLFRGPPGVPLAQLPVQLMDSSFHLSPTGALLARQQRNGQVMVQPTDGAVVPRLQTYAGRFSAELQFVLGDRWLLLQSGSRAMHLLRWDNGPLVILRLSHHRQPARLDFRPGTVPFEFVARALGKSDSQLWREAGTAPRVPGWVKYDPQRFTAGAAIILPISGQVGSIYHLTVVADRYGQVAIFDRRRELVCMFFVFRDQLSGWLPDGSCFGPASPSRRPPGEADLANFGRALCAAFDGRSQ